MRLLANIVSFLRIPLAILVVISSLRGNWLAAFEYIVLAWMTDAIDGPIARLGKAKSSDSLFDVDGISDACLSTAMITGLYLTKHLALVHLCLMALTLWPFWAGYIWAKPSSRFKRFCVCYIPCYHMVVIACALGGYYGNLALPGHFPELIVASLAAVIILAFLKRNRLRSWLPARRLVGSRKIAAPSLT